MRHSGSPGPCCWPDCLSWTTFLGKDVVITTHSHQCFILFGIFVSLLPLIKTVTQYSISLGGFNITFLIEFSYKKDGKILGHTLWPVTCSQVLTLKSESLYSRLLLLLLLLSCFSHVRLCATPETAAHQASPSLGFSRQEHWSGLPFPSPRHKSEKWKWSRSVVPDSSRPHGLQPTRLLCPWIFQARVLEWGAIAFSGTVF